MNRSKYELFSNLPKMIFSFIASYILCYFLLGDNFFINYFLVPINSINQTSFISSEMFLLYLSSFHTFFIQSTIYSIIFCILELWSIDDDYDKNHYIIDGNKITKEFLLKIKILKHIPIFSIINILVYLFSGKTLLNRIYKIDYDFENKEPEFDRALRSWFKLVIFFMVIQFSLSTITYKNDKEVFMFKEIKEIEVVKQVESNILIDSDNDNIYNLVVVFDDAYIHYNKLEFAKNEIVANLKNNSDFIIKKYSNSSTDIKGFNIMMYNDYTKTWDKHFYSVDFEVEYKLESISNNILDIDIYVKNNSLVYNILTNLKKDEMGWDMAEFMLKEFENDISNQLIIDRIKKIIDYSGDIDKYVVNILSKEYYMSKNNSFFTYVKDKEDDEWYYYDNRFFTLDKREKEFESDVLNVYNKISLDFSNLYETGEIYIISKDDIDIEKIYTILNTSDSGSLLKRQVKYIGKVNNIKLIIKGE